MKKKKKPPADEIRLMIQITEMWVPLITSHTHQDLKSHIIYIKAQRERERNLGILLLDKGFGSLCKIGNHAKSPFPILDDCNSRSPSFQSFFRGVLGLNVEVLLQIALHINESYGNQMNDSVKKNKPTQEDGKI